MTEIYSIIGLEYPVILIDRPSPEMINKWGELAYVSTPDREKILALGYGKFEPACECLRKTLKKKGKKK